MFFLISFKTKNVSNTLDNFQSIKNNKRINESSSAASKRYKQITNKEYAEKIFIDRVNENIELPQKNFKKHL
ncbi:hypothetical protein [Planococcus sp. SSTMD024]|uniref:hypothetical protein n=1 Tax=Planococcus sp. SSTMD024 TaxID=3242163 RepID=UPI00351E9CBF